MVYPDRLEAIEKGTITSEAQLAAAALVSGDDVLVDVCADPPELAILSADSVDALFHEDFFEDFVGRGSDEMDCPVKIKMEVTAASSAVTSARSIPTNMSVDNRAYFIGEKRGSTNVVRPSVGNLKSTVSSSVVSERAFAAIRAVV